MMATSVIDDVFQMPLAPRTLEETGLSGDLVLQQVVKALHFAGELTGTELAARLGVAFSVIESSIEILKRDHHCAIVGGSVAGAPLYRYRLTDAGRVRAMLFLEHSKYVGQLPVPLAQYRVRMTESTRDRTSTVTRELVEHAFAHLVIGRRVLDQLGPAIAARHSLFIYGPSGNGKTVISKAIRNVLVGDIAIPHALEVDGNIVRLFDPVNHEPVSTSANSSDLERYPQIDLRWVRCRRPVVMAGGELTLDDLKLGFSRAAGVYRAPLQLISNGGVFVIDDFGRQQVSPRDLLNRWIVPLESRVDYLTLESGQKFEVPFEVLIVFATNLRPADIIDEALLRRIQFKVFAESPTEADFTQIFENYCRHRNLAFDPALAAQVIATELRPRGVPIRSCQPRDLIDRALSLAEYFGHPRALSAELLSAAAASYFVQDEHVHET